MADQKQFSLQVNLAGIAPMDLFDDLPSGPYPVRITDVALVDGNEGRKNFRFDVTVIEGEQKGRTQLVTIGSDFSKDGNRKHMKALLTGILQHEGKDLSVLETPSLGINEKTFLGADGKGRVAFLYVKAAAEGETITINGQEKKKLADRQFITKERYTRVAASVAAGATATGGQQFAVQGAQTPQPSNGAQPMGQLGAVI